MEESINEDTITSENSTYENRNITEWKSNRTHIIALLSWTMGFTNIFHTPQLLLKGSFMDFIATYITLMIIMGIPLTFMELSISQYSSQSTKSWNLCPFFRGIGYSKLIIVFIFQIYYNVLNSYVLLYTFSSFSTSVKWSNCNASWANSSCYNLKEYKSMKHGKGYQPSVEQFWFNGVLKLNENCQKLVAVKQISKRKLYKYSEEALARALLEIREGRKGIREASRDFGVPRTTIQDRLKGRAPEKLGKVGPEPVLTIDGEKKIADWVAAIAKCGFPIKKRDLIETVQKIIKDSAKKNILQNEKIIKNGIPGQKWYANFLRRHPEISLRESEGINKARAVVTEQSIRLWFSELRKFLEENNIMDIFDDPDRILNGDESGFSLCPKTGKVLAPKGWRNLYTIKKSNDKENITVLVVFTASGHIWDIFYEYIANDFNNWLTENSIKKPVIVFIDGHRSHMTLPLSKFCEKNEIILYALPPNTTHMLQPADVSVFRPLKQGWKNTVRNWQSKPENINSSVTKINFCRLFKETLSASDMTNAIKNGFRKCGLFPLDPDSVDYTKCVQNALERRSNQSQLPPIDIITYEEYRSAEKILKKIEPKLQTYGINVDVIMNEINILENNRLNGNDKADDLEIPMEIQEGEVDNLFSMPQVGSIVSMDDISVIPLVPTHTLFNMEAELQTVYLEQSDPKPQSEQEETSASYDLSVPLTDTPQPDLENLGSIDSSAVPLPEIPEPVDQAIYISDSPLSEILSHNNGKEPQKANAISLKLQESNKSENLPNVGKQEHAQKIVLHSVEILQRGITEKLPVLKPIQPFHAFEHHLSFPDPINGKEQKENIVAESSPSAKQKIRCAACEEELESDTEADGDKNIGCDICPRWYHLKCSEFRHLSYDEAAIKEYT
ncbi:hypothetical protein NQ314_017726 [Rhamnusium bicolor]|uniref:HTH CENPB-type domain-containing protein n=1 Tax=Rhamnusium bicolor TaxID=1586634 RepID=A0AAV8WST1_9CUCU|nr:hypothetical protein NQ314_017726 [Rhamnusium bicolor]